MLERISLRDKNRKTEYVDRRNLNFVEGRVFDGWRNLTGAVVWWRLTNNKKLECSIRILVTITCFVLFQGVNSRLRRSD